jgi:aspartyl/glutamyl-tRNA(Asn/Gln) amidotransferase C subunit
MSGLSASEIDHLAKLARLYLDPEEKARFSNELPKIAEFVEALQITTNSQKDAVSLTTLRDDVPSNNGLTLDQLQQLSPLWERNQNVVPPVFGVSDDV